MDRWLEDWEWNDRKRLHILFRQTSLKLDKSPGHNRKDDERNGGRMNRWKDGLFKRWSLCGWHAMEWNRGEVGKQIPNHIFVQGFGTKFSPSRTFLCGRPWVLRAEAAGAFNRQSRVALGWLKKWRVKWRRGVPIRGENGGVLKSFWRSRRKRKKVRERGRFLLNSCIQYKPPVHSATGL